MSLLKWIGMSQPGKSAPAEGMPSGDDRYFGLENFGNTCYCNSVLQALYFCKPFRKCVANFPIPSGPSPPTTPTLSSLDGSTINLPSNTTSSTLQEPPKPKRRSAPSLSLSSKNAPPQPQLPTPVADDPPIHTVLKVEENLFTSLKDLFWKIEKQKKRTGAMAPTQFVNTVKRENEIFRSTMHQDAHEFLNFLLNKIAEDVIDLKKLDLSKIRSESGDSTPTPSNEKENGSCEEHSIDSNTSWVQDLFEGVLVNETRCLTCETVTCKEESFLDLSIDIEQNSSVTSCLRQFSASEMLRQKNKYFCDVCNGLQEAEKRMKVKKIPNILALHLKRFKYQEQLQKFTKLSYRVVFPLTLRLFNTTHDSQDTDRLYKLFAFVVHIGSGPNHGHYVAVVKSGDHWLLFDDDIVEMLDEEDIPKYFGDLPGVGSGYVLFYEAADLNPQADDSHMNMTIPINTTSLPLSNQSSFSLSSNPSIINEETDLRKIAPPSFALNNRIASSPNLGTGPSGWFSSSSRKANKDKVIEKGIPKHDFYRTPDPKKENFNIPTPAMSMATWR